MSRSAQNIHTLIHIHKSMEPAEQCRPTATQHTNTHCKYDVHVTVHRVTFHNQLDALISEIYYWKEILHVSDSSSVHHQEYFTVHTAMVCHTGLLTACEQEHCMYVCMNKTKDVI
jgi:hypothetical protein